MTGASAGRRRQLRATCWSDIALAETPALGLSSAQALELQQRGQPGGGSTDGEAITASSRTSTQVAGSGVLHVRFAASPALSSVHSATQLGFRWMYGSLSGPGRWIQIHGSSLGLSRSGVSAPSPDLVPDRHTQLWCARPPRWRKEGAGDARGHHHNAGEGARR